MTAPDFENISQLFIQIIKAGKFSFKNKKYWEELMAYFPLILHQPHTERHAQQFFYWYMCICCRGNVFT
jgi:hypothetical protein